MNTRQRFGVFLLALLAMAGPAWADGEPSAEQRRQLEKKAQDLDQEAQRHYQRGAYTETVALLKEALDIHRRLYPREKYPRGHPQLARGLYALGVAQTAAGEYGQAEPLCREALDMCRALYPREEHPQGHPELTVSINILGHLYHQAGEYTKAEPLLKEALAMRRTLFPREKYPQGHPELATSINNLALLHQAVGEYGKAEPLFKESLEMGRALYPREKYPRGHPDLANSINNLAKLHQAAGEYDKAEPLHREELDMKRALYPREQFPLGHPDLANSINDLAALHYARGAYDKAEPLGKEALDMRRALFPRERYPQGHPDLATSIVNLAFLHQSAGEYAKAEPLFREALAMYQGLALRYADLVAEAAALNYIATLPLSRDGPLTASRHLPGTDVYDAVWDSRAALTRLLERRHRDLMASRDPETADLADRLRRARSDLARRLLTLSRGPDPQGATVQQLTDAKEDLEKRIAARLKLAPRTAATSPTPKQLAQALPQGTAFLDLYRHADIESERDATGKKRSKRTFRYVAFVLLPGQPAVRVELKEGEPIERAWADWHKAILTDRPDARAEREAAARFAEHFWQPIREVLPADLKTLYLVPDGELYQVPWGALPGRKPDTVLLDECALCLVPHGPFLLERLQAQPPAGAGDTVLVYGGVDYQNGPAAAVKHDDLGGPPLRARRLAWPELPGTAREQEQIVALARKVLKAEPISRGGRNASTKQLEEDLPRARYAHLATHGFLADPEFRSALQVNPKDFVVRGHNERLGAARSPLVLSGLVLAGANRQGKEAADDRGIITAEGLIALRLEDMELAVLSACETGRGDVAGGEGISGLQRAFNVAGCKNVVASLWKVNDGATQALMLLFYKNLWEKKLDPAEALRRAQLTLYRHPEAVEQAAQRGPIDFSESALPKVADKLGEKALRSPAAHWAAFTFSGVRPIEVPRGK
jgi:CHAT domain-containing protein